MLGRLILLIAFFIAVMSIIQLLKKTPKKQRKNLYWKLGIGLAALALVLLAVTGRVHWISALIGAALPFIRGAIPWLMRYLPMLHHFQKNRFQASPTPGNCSEVKTALLVMTLDHDTNQLHGEVINGPFSGYPLDTLNLKQLQTLLDYCQQQDSDSEKLLVSYLNHRFGNSWQNSHSDTVEENMGVKEAYAMLGLSTDASKKEVIQAHRKMMQKVHPDHGGSDYLASQINHAKDLLIKRFT